MLLPLIFASCSGAVEAGDVRITLENRTGDPLIYLVLTHDVASRTFLPATFQVEDLSRAPGPSLGPGAAVALTRAEIQGEHHRGDPLAFYLYQVRDGVALRRRDIASLSSGELRRRGFRVVVAPRP